MNLESDEWAPTDDQPNCVLLETLHTSCRLVNCILYPVVYGPSWLEITKEVDK